MSRYLCSVLLCTLMGACITGCSNKRLDVFSVMETPILEVSAPFGVNLKIRIIGFRFVDVVPETAKREDEGPRPGDLTP